MQHILSSLITNTIASGSMTTRVRVPRYKDEDERRKTIPRIGRTRDDEDSIPTGTILKENDDV